VLLSRLPLPSIKRAPKGSLRNPPSSLEGGALDLHVLGLPPAFALSQDQTLKLDENFSRLITTFDEVPRLPMSAERTPDLHRAYACRFPDKVLT
jgi:hypothetical protein